MNYEFHLDEWLARFPLQERLGRYAGGDITSPVDICNVEWLRRAMVDQYEWGEAVPVDIFVMSKGEPVNRFATKIGGLPYRPRNLPWPRRDSGRPLSLLGQFNFTNSLDIVGKLPGDVLLIFGDDSDGIPQPFHMEWHNLELQDLVQPADIPSGGMTIAPCYGNRHRTLSYPDAVRTTTTKYPQCHGKDVWYSQFITALQATQIGRAPRFVQDANRSSPGKPLCTIASVQPDKHAAWPWVNVPEPLSPPGKWPSRGDELMIGDLGCIYVFMEDNGQLHAAASCY